MDNLSINFVVGCVFFFFFNDTATTEIYTLSLQRRSSDLKASREELEQKTQQMQQEHAAWQDRIRSLLGKMDEDRKSTRRTPVTQWSRMPSSAWKKKKNNKNKKQ